MAVAATPPPDRPYRSWNRGFPLCGLGDRCIIFAFVSCSAPAESRSSALAAARIWLGALAVVMVAVLFAPPVASATTAPELPQTVWLCRPGLAENPCESDLTATVVQPDGKQSIDHAKPAERPRVDCFYLYPTVSAQPSTNADLTVDPEQTAIAELQASRFSQVCRVFAPMYPQTTLAALSRTGGRPTPDQDALAYPGVLSAWRDYLAHDNHGRGVVFIGHSQGARMLTKLVQTEIDPNPKLRRRLVSAVLLGGHVTVAAGRDTGGSFQHIPACHARRDTGCVVAYSSFAQPPPAGSLFGKVDAYVRGLSGRNDNVNLQVLCVNPAALGGRTGALEAYRRTTPFPGPLGPAFDPRPPAATPWVEYPHLYTAKCQTANDATWLQITDIGTPSDQRARVGDALDPTYGLHVADVNIALGNLVDLVRAQATKYRP
jgi:hypothetical protein